MRRQTSRSVPAQAHVMTAAPRVNGQYSLTIQASTQHPRFQRQAIPSVSWLGKNANNQWPFGDTLMTVGGPYEAGEWVIGSGDTTKNCFEEGKRRPMMMGWVACAVNIVDELDQATGLPCEWVKVEMPAKTMTHLRTSSTRGCKSHQFVRHLPSSLMVFPFPSEGDMRVEDNLGNT